MRNEFTAVIERDGDWYIACCPEVPGANGQGRTKDEAKQSLTEAVEFVLADRRAGSASVGPFRELRRGGKIPNMKVATGTVVDGKVVVEGETLAEGSSVTVVLREDDEAFELTPQEEAELLESIAAIERGEFVSGERLLERLRRFGSQSHGR